MIDPVAVQDLKSRVDLAGIAGGVTDLRRRGHTLCGPCPFCGGGKRSVRFEVMPKQQRWVCAVCQDGGDVIAFVQRLDGCSFSEAVERLGGAREVSPEIRAKLERKAAAEARAEAKRRADQQEKARAIWESSVPAEGSPVERYLAARGLPAAMLPHGLPRALRFYPDLPYWWHVPGQPPEIIHTGPAMVAAIAGADGGLIATHCTYLTDDGAAKLRLLKRDGEDPAAKKIRGNSKGGAIRLSPRAPVLVIGEGIETTLTAFVAATRLYPGRAAAWCGVALGNIAGRSLRGGHRHPEKPGIWIPGEEPDPDEPGLILPEWAEEVVLCGDGDSDPLFTRARLVCAAKRFSRTGRRVRIAMAEPGKDFNDMVKP